jgi:serine/threonine protein kinase
MILELLGEGSFGQVVKAQHIKTGKLYAIKLIKNVFKDEFSARKILREIQILRVFSKMERNIFTTKIFDIITPDMDVP